ncbi:MAG: hypothetical protein NT098_05665 [Candidatus Parcubacteria bacterium]|nr:hypothetical protein [Candidatus Parcubacteria bacterium]
MKRKIFTVTVCGTEKFQKAMDDLSSEVSRFEDEHTCGEPKTTWLQSTRTSGGSHDNMLTFTAIVEYRS